MLVALSLPPRGSDRDVATPEIIWAGEGRPWTSEDVRREFILACQTLAEALRKHPATVRIAAKMRRRMFG